MTFGLLWPETPDIVETAWICLYFLHPVLLTGNLHHFAVCFRISSRYKFHFFTV
jgi:hypothetical protein